MHYHHSGYPGGLKTESLGDWFKKDPERAFREAVRGMLPHGVLGRQMARKLKVYVGGEHPHQAQGVVPYTLPHVKIEEREEWLENSTAPDVARTLSPRSGSFRARAG